MSLELKKPEVATFQNGETLEVKANITLSDGRKVKIAEGLGRHSELVTEIMGEDRSQKYFSLYMSLLVLIEDKTVSPEDLRNMRAKDYNAIYVEFLKINF
jgi:hypothetical protein